MERGELQAGNLGLTLAEGKSLLASVQKNLIARQVATWVEEHAHCTSCARVLGHKGRHQILVRTVFGKMEIESPRLYRCSCKGRTRTSFSPVAELLPERTSPELRYLQTKWASLVSYGMTLGLLKDTLPVSEDLNVTAISNDVARAAGRLDAELGEEEFAFVEGTPAHWQRLPDPAGPLVVGIDGGYVHARDRQRGEGWFEVIIGKSIPSIGDAKCFGFVSWLDSKPKRRLYDVLASQGLQMNQQITFLSDGDDTVRDLQIRMSPQAEHVLDWFHITMRLTLMHQLAVGLANAWHTASTPPACDENEDDRAGSIPDLLATIERLKWNLWHGKVRRALEIVDDLEDEVESIASELPNTMKLARMLREFGGYIRANQAFIPNYGDRWRNGEAISTAFAESAVNQIISRRFAKKQQMRWTTRGCHQLLQVRTRVLNEEWRATMERWNPGMSAAA